MKAQVRLGHECLFRVVRAKVRLAPGTRWLAGAETGKVLPRESGMVRGLMRWTRKASPGSFFGK